MQRPALIALSLPGTLFAESGVQAVQEAQRKWIESYNRHDDRTLASIEADNFQVVFGDGRVQNKADQVAAVRRTLPAGAEYEVVIEATEVRLYGNAAVLTGIVVERGKFPNDHGIMQPFNQRSRHTDTWIFQKGRWQVVSSHLSDLK